jgi:hypothetical protein
MADVFVDSGGSNTSPYDTWAKAATTLATGEAALSAGDRLIIAHDHGETSTTGLALTFPGTKASPNIIISSTNAGGGSTVTYTKATTPQFEQITTSTSDIDISGYFQAYGIYLKAARNMDFITSGVSIFDDCKLEYASLAAANMTIAGSARRLYTYNTDINYVRTTSTSWVFAINGIGAGAIMHGGSLSSGAAGTFTGIANISNASGVVRLRGVDMSGIACSTIVNTGAAAVFDTLTCEVANCDLPSSFSELVNTDAEANWIGDEFTLHVSDTANTVYREETVGWNGKHISETGIYRTAGASNGTTNFSHKVTSSANPEGLVGYRYRLADMWADLSTGKTFTAEIAQDGTTTALQDDEIWIDVEFPDDLAAVTHLESDRVADITTTPADQTSSTAAWTGLSGTEKRQKLEVTTSATGKEGPCTVWLHLAKPSTTVYVDPLVDIT